MLSTTAPNSGKVIPFPAAARRTPSLLQRATEEASAEQAGLRIWLDGTEAEPVVRVVAPGGGEFAVTGEEGLICLCRLDSGGGACDRGLFQTMSAAFLAIRHEAAHSWTIAAPTPRRDKPCRPALTARVLSLGKSGAPSPRPQSP